jgi:hypothetical protein
MFYFKSRTSAQTPCPIPIGQGVREGPATCARPSSRAPQLSEYARDWSAREPSQHARERPHGRPSHDARLLRGVPWRRVRGAPLLSYVRRGT